MSYLSMFLSACGQLYQLLDSLLELQDTLSSRWREGGRGAQDDETQETFAASEDEENICSDSEGEKEKEKLTATAGGRRRRKRKRSHSGRRDYEKEISWRHKELRPHHNAVLSKWDEKTRLASGKITSKVCWHLLS